jgi:hypothetical protein
MRSSVAAIPPRLHSSSCRRPIRSISRIDTMVMITLTAPTLAVARMEVAADERPAVWKISGAK